MRRRKKTSFRKQKRTNKRINTYRMARGGIRL
jgi:hypothetical protein